MRVSHNTFASGSDSEQLALRPTGLKEDQAIARQGTGAGRVLSALFDTPLLFAGQRVIGVMCFGAAAQQECLAFEDGDMRRREGLAKVALGLWHPIRSNVLIVDRARAAPDVLAGFLVQCHHELVVATVEVHY